jgi:serine phosphatase RsbU (regulator of sigma subunit)/pSer/pThr/pTyr-binding forkhead associated (FHA) protein
LWVRTSDHKVRRVPLESDAVSVGRAHTNDLCYPDDETLSREHVRFEREGEGWSVVDLESKNGTIVNGCRLTGRQALKAGDRLTVGQLTITCGEPRDQKDTDVVFVPSPSSDLNPSATVMTSLEGLLSGESTGPVQASQDSLEIDSQRQFQLPVVRVLIRAGRELAGHQPLEELFSLILSQAIEAVKAERGILMTVEGGKLIPRATNGEGFRISTMIRDRVMENKESLLVRDVGQEKTLVNQLSISEQQIHSLMAVPLQTQEQVIGLIYVDSRLFVREFTPDDLNLLTVLANVAAIRLDRERHLELQRREQRRTRDLEQAAEIQRGILPADPPRVDGLELAGHNAPCRTVGGDYYDFIRYPDGRLALVLGDVAGKGMAAAMLMSNLQARVQLLTEDPPPLGALITRLDRSLQANCPSNRFITFFMCVVDPITGEIAHCNAGHNPALLVRASGEVEPLEAVGTVLGILPHLGYEERVGRLEVGDLIAIYSDGVTEATGRDGNEFGQTRLADLVVDKRSDPAPEIVRAVRRALRDWCASDVAEDDVTLIVARRVPIP